MNCLNSKCEYYDIDVENNCHYSRSFGGTENCPTIARKTIMSELSLKEKALPAFNYTLDEGGGMKAIVTQLYNKGKRVPRNKRAKPFEGDLNLSDHKNIVLMRLVTEACLMKDTGLHVICPLVDARVTSISGDGLTIRGVEYDSGKEVAQEWRVRFPKEA